MVFGLFKKDEQAKLNNPIVVEIPYGNPAKAVKPASIWQYNTALGNGSYGETGERFCFGDIG